MGAYVIQLAKEAGLFVIGTAGSSKEYAKSLGADVVIDYREHKDDNFVGLLCNFIDPKPRRIFHVHPDICIGSSGGRSPGITCIRRR